MSDESLYKTLVESIVDYAIYMIDRKGYVTSWNAGAQRIKGYRADEVIGKHFSNFYTEEDRKQGLPDTALRTADTEGRFEQDGWRVRKDGSRFWAHVTIDPIRNEAGKVVGFAKITRDNTEKKQSESALARAQQALFQTQKFESLGQLTGGVAHDFNNLLMAMTASLELISKRIPQNDERTLQLLLNITKGAERGAVLVQRMLAFARRQELTITSVDLAFLIQGMVGLLERALGPAGTLVLDIPDQLPAMHTDAHQLESALLNLVVNARDAMPNGGTITIQARQEFAPMPGVELRSGKYLRISVIDSGWGMDERTVLRATEPFFTTKGVGNGTGLGLSMVQGLAEQSGGKVRISSRLGSGTTVDLILPTNGSLRDPDVRPIAQQMERPDNEMNRTGLVVLVVDDDELVLSATSALLDDMGYRVLEASGGKRALELVARTPVIDLILTDQVMPEITGLQLANAVHAIRPDIPIVLASGFSDIGTPVPKHIYRMTKPYSRKQLESALNTLVAKIS